MEYIGVYTLIALVILLTLLVIPVALLIASYNPVECIGKALNDLLLSIPYTKNPIEVQYSGKLVIIFRWYDLGSLSNSLILPLFVSLTATTLGLLYALTVYLYAVPKPMILLPLLAYLPIPFVKAVVLQNILDPGIGLVNRVLGSIGIAIRVEGLAAVALYQVLTLFPFSYALHLSYLSMLPRELIESGYVLGSSPQQLALKILLPMIKPAVFTSLALVYVLSLDDLEAPLIFEGYPDVRGLLSYKAYVFFVSEVYKGFSQKAIGYTIILILLTASVFALSAKYLVTVYKSFGSALVKPPNVYRDIPNSKGISVAILMLFIAIASATPTIVSFLYTFIDPITLKPSASANLLLSPTRVRSSINTVIYTTTSLLACIVLALPLAFWSSRRRKLYRCIEVLSMLPLSIPGVAVAYSYVQLFGGFPINPFNTPWLYLILSYTLRRLPYVYIALRNAISSIPQDLEESAQNLGASTTKTLETITTPLALSTATPGLALATISIATEVSTSITIGGLGTTQGWLNSAPLVYTIYRDTTSGGIVVVGVYALAITTIIAIAIIIAKTVVKILAKSF